MREPEEPRCLTPPAAKSESKQKKLPRQQPSKNGRANHKGLVLIIAQPTTKRKGQIKMTINEMNSKIKELRELRRMSDELQAEIEALQDDFKAEMNAQGVDTLAGADWKVSWKEVQSSRLDSKALKASLPDVAASFTKVTTARRFVLA